MKKYFDCYPIITMVLLVALKLDNRINMSWVFVLFPIWGSMIMYPICEKITHIYLRDKNNINIYSGNPLFWDYKRKRIYYDWD